MLAVCVAFAGLVFVWLILKPHRKDTSHADATFLSANPADTSSRPPAPADEIDWHPRSAYPGLEPGASDGWDSRGLDEAAWRYAKHRSSL